MADRGGGMTRLRKTRTSATSIPWETAQDSRLSFRARGVLTYLLSKPPGWRVDATQIAGDGAEGRDAIEKALRELRQAGYYRVVRYRYDGVDQAGVFRRGMFATEGWIADAPEQEWADEYARSRGRAVTLKDYDPAGHDIEAPTPENPFSEKRSPSSDPTPENPVSELPIPGFPSPDSPSPENPGFLSRRESESKESESSSVEGSLRSPSTGAPAETTGQAAKRIIDDWTKWLRSNNKPVLASERSWHSLRTLITQSLDAGYTEPQIKNALIACDVAFPSKTQYQSRLGEIIAGRKPRRGVYTESAERDLPPEELFGSGGAE